MAGAVDEAGGGEGAKFKHRGDSEYLAAAAVAASGRLAPSFFGCPVAMPTLAASFVTGFC